MPVAAEIGAEMQILKKLGQEAGSDPKRSRYGCFLPDLTGLASVSSAANLPAHYIRREWRRSKPARIPFPLCLTLTGV